MSSLVYRFVSLIVGWGACTSVWPRFRSFVRSFVLAGGACTLPCCGGFRNARLCFFLVFVVVGFWPPPLLIKNILGFAVLGDAACVRLSVVVCDLSG